MRTIMSCGFFGTMTLVLGMQPQAIRASVISTTNLTVISAPATVGANFLINGGLPDAVIFNERQNVTLGSALTTDTGVIAAGTAVNSQFFALNGVSDVILDSSATFNGSVLGVIYLDGSANWASTDFLGATGTTYSEDPNVCPLCGFEAGDTATINGNRVDFHNDFSEPGDFARVITSATTIPEPSTRWVLLGIAFAFLAKRVFGGQRFAT